MPLIIGVTGSIAGGKSSLCDRLVERWDAVHSDADKLVHRLYEPGRTAFDRVVEEFGEEVVGQDGFIDRGVLGDKVFGNPERLAKLTSVIGTESIVGEANRVTAEWRKELPDAAVAIIEVIILIESDISAGCDQTWLVATENEHALRRIMERNDLSREDAQQRLSSGRDWRERVPAADHVFHNNGALDDFLAEVDAVAERTIDAHRAGTLPRSRWFEWREQNPRPERAERQQES